MNHPTKQPQISYIRGEHGPHIIAHRLTYDGIEVSQWSDGAITAERLMPPRHNKAPAGAEK